MSDVAHGPNGNGVRLSTTMVNLIVVVATMTWAVSQIASLVNSKYDTPNAVNYAFFAIVGSVFGSQMLRGVIK